MLWVNLIMDTFAALALATEPPTNSLLDRQPYSKKEYIVTPNMWRNILCQAGLQMIILSVILFLGPVIFGVQNSAYMKKYSVKEAEHYTIFF